MTNNAKQRSLYFVLVFMMWNIEEIFNLGVVNRATVVIWRVVTLTINGKKNDIANLYILQLRLCIFASLTLIANTPEKWKIIPHKTSMQNCLQSEINPHWNYFVCLSRFKYDSIALTQPVEFQKFIADLFDNEVCLKFF